MKNFEKYFDGDWFKVMDYIYAKANISDCNGCPFDGIGCDFLDCSWSMNKFKSWLNKDCYDLKACPFCGNKHLVFINEEGEDWNGDEGYGYNIAVCCPMNEGGCGAFSGYFKKVEDAMKHWNCRCSVEDDDEF